MNPSEPKPIEEARIYYAGEKAAGIRSSAFTMTLFLDPLCFDTDDWPRIVEETREQIASLYNDIHDDGKPQVTFDFEYERDMP